MKTLNNFSIKSIFYLLILMDKDEKIKKLEGAIEEMANSLETTVTKSKMRLES